MRVSAIIVAAGFGQRLGGPLPKQFQSVSGKPLIFHTLRAFESCAAIHDILLVVAEEWLPYASQEIVDKFAFVKIQKVVSGGEKRQDSVHAGLLALEGPPDLVAIHDAVRPLICPQNITEVITAGEEHGAALLAVPATDTIKIEKSGFVHHTPDRNTLLSVQTPQVFGYKLILDAHCRAREEGYYATDDSALVERLGHRVKVVRGDERNIKVTVPVDLMLAERFLEMDR